MRIESRHFVESLERMGLKSHDFGVSFSCVVYCVSDICTVGAWFVTGLWPFCWFNKEAIIKRQLDL